MKNLISNLVKPSLIIYFIAITLSLLIVSGSSHGYEDSIYTSTNMMFWFVLIFGYVLGTLVVLFFEKWNVLGKIILLMNTVSLISLYIIKGQFTYNVGGDVGTHINNLYQLIDTGFTTSHYPGRYIYSAILENITTLDQIHIQNLTGVIGLLIFILGFYQLAKLAFGCKKQVDIIYILLMYIPFGSMIFMTGGWGLFFYIPFLFGLFLFPCFVYLVLTTIVSNQNKFRYLIFTIIYSIILTISHPVIGLISIIFCLSAFCWQLYVSYKLSKDIRKLVSNLFKNTSLTVLLISCIIYVLWIYLTGDLVHPVDSFMGLFDVSDSSSYADHYIYSANEFAISNLSYLIDLASRQLSILLVLSILSLIGLLIGYHSRKKGCKDLIINSSLEPLVLFSGLLLIFIALVFIINYSFEPGRVVPILTGLMILFSSITLVQLWYKAKNSWRKRVNYGVLYSLIFVILLVFFSISGIITYYPSSDITYQPSQQSTNAELDGFSFYLQYLYPTYKQYGIDTIQLKRYALSIFNSDFVLTKNKYDFSVDYEYLEEPPANFGYGDKERVDFQESSISYLTILTFVIEKYSNNPLWKDTAKWTYDDIRHLDMDKCVSKVYSNPAMTIYTIIPAIQ